MRLLGKLGPGRPPRLFFRGTGQGDRAVTVIAWDGRELAADSGSFGSGSGLREVCPWPKIIREPNGWLVGIAGVADTAYALQQAWLDGDALWADLDAIRARCALRDGDDVSELVVKLDGSAWNRFNLCRMCPAVAPVAIGEERAVSYVLGAMHAGVSAGAAVRLAAQHCIWASAPVISLALEP